MVTATCRKCEKPNDTDRVVCSACYVALLGESPKLFESGKDTWTTGCEAEFIRRCHANQPVALKEGYRPGTFQNYARLVLDGYRTYGPGVDVDEIKALCQRLMAQTGGGA